MRKSGREEEYLEREQLLDDIDARLRDFEALKTQEKAQKETEKRKREVAGAIVLREAVGQLEKAYAESTGNSSSESDGPPKKKHVLGAFLDKVADQVTSSGDRNNAFKERKLALLERQLEQQQQQLELQREMQKQQFEVLMKLVEKLTKT
ncbi:hypothetical protein P43SY_010345 [Pythium insidiosum]|uniref:Uncharacterized protein n=1 Tax=Pythium insidiosum TaxID=114742 RepID=A0AAD5Q156_PYTIN|nr:hypothetical protein P43SY_010345 [Pythium insidiosum]